MKKVPFGGLFLALLLHAFPAWGAVDYLLEIDGIPGESTAEGRLNLIEIQNFSFGASNPAAVGSGGLSAGKVSFSDISFSKVIDRSTPLLFLNSAQGKTIKKAVLYIRKSGGDAKPLEFYVLTMEDVLVTSVQSSGSSGDIPSESFSLAFGKIHLSYRSQLPTGALGDPVRFGWDVVANRPYSPAP